MKIPVSIYTASFLLLLAGACSKEKPTPQTQNYSQYTFETPEVTGSIFYVDPVHGTMNGDGSAANPWHTLQEVVESDLIAYYQHTEARNPDSPLELVNENAPVKGGDKIVLRSGYHGYLKRNAFIFKEWLTIEAEYGDEAVLSQIRFEGAFSKVYLNNLTVSKDSYVGEEDYWVADEINRNSDACVYLRADDFWGRASDIKLRNLKLMTTENTDGWSAAEWIEKAAAGINVRNVPRTEVFSCTITNVSMGLSFSDHSDQSNAVGNNISYYSVDGVRLISNDIYFGYNTITDCIKVDDNHDDAIQSYSIGNDGTVGQGVISDVVLWGNIIIGSTDLEHPLAGRPQGIGCFDGFFDNWVVENNVVVVDHYHGIAFYGMRNGIIAHNTVVDLIPGNDISPWILINDHKDERPSLNCRVINNIASRSVGVGDQNISEANIVFRDFGDPEVSQIFNNPSLLDYSLGDNDFTRTHLIDMGIVSDRAASCKVDIRGLARDHSPDLGAYEYAVILEQ